MMPARPLAPATASSTSPTMISISARRCGGREQAGQALLGAVQFLDRHDRPDVGAPLMEGIGRQRRGRCAPGPRGLRAWSSGGRRVTRPESAASGASSAISSRRAGRRSARPRRQRSPSMPSSCHHLGGRPLDRLAADDRRHRDHRRAAGRERRAQSRHRQDRLDADERDWTGRSRPRAASGSSAPRARSAAAAPLRHREDAARARPARTAGARNNPGSRSSPRRCSTRVRTGSSLIGRTRPRCPGGGRNRAVICRQRLAGARGAACARHGSRDRRRPAGTRSSPPSVPSASMKDQVSSRRPQPVAGSSRPASV